MPLCPKCKIEYPAGTVRCKTCGKDLTSHLEEAVSNKEISIKEAADCNAEQEKTPADSHTYIKKEVRQKELLSSAYALLMVGILGLILLLLIILGIIRLPFLSNINGFTYAVLFLLLCFFTVYGILSLKGAKKAGQEALEENKLIQEVLEWFRKNIDTFVIEKDVTKEMDQEEKYLIITDNIKNIILTSYGDIPEGLAEILSDTLYSELYE